jgi:peptide methionine sulfoxide reductase MsrB
MHPPVYFNPIPGVIDSTEDTSYGVTRDEVHCSRCRGTLHEPAKQDKTNLVV